MSNPNPVGEVTIPEDVPHLYASMDSDEPVSADLVQFVHRLIEDASIGGGDMLPAIVEQRELALSVARAILAERQSATAIERERCAIIAEMHDHRGDIASSIRGKP